jgi:ABC-type multidrug transport system fused ATPase/permease subunit
MSHCALVPATTITIISLLNLLNTIMTSMPQILMLPIQAYVAYGRSMKLFLAADAPSCSVGAETVSEPIAPLVFSLDAASFGYKEPDAATPTVVLRSIDLNIAKNEHVAIVGANGSGKSALLLALLHEFELLDGSLKRARQPYSFAQQSAVLSGGTIRSNITRGHAFDAERYDAVIDACGLRPDLEMMPQGDQSVVGDRGMRLSGGQKQRVSMARACYAPAATVLLDDPLSALDRITTRHVCEELFGKVLRDRTLIVALSSARTARRLSASRRDAQVDCQQHAVHALDSEKSRHDAEGLS